MTVRFVCDSTADLTAEEAALFGVAVVPLHVLFGDDDYRDGIDLTPDEFYQRMRESSVHPKTSQPSAGDFITAFANASDDGASVICTTISAALSGTFQAALQAKVALKDRDIRVLDTRAVTVAHQLVLRAGIAVRDGGGSPDACVEAMERVMETQRLLASLPTLEYLRRGGRIGGAQALLGSFLSIRPVLDVTRGHVEVFQKVRTFSRAINRILEELERAHASWSSTLAGIAHAGVPDDAQELGRRVAVITGAPPIVVPIGPVIGCHAGPGAVGVAFARATDRASQSGRAAP